MTLTARLQDGSNSPRLPHLSACQKPPADVMLAFRRHQSALSTSEGTMQYLAEHSTYLLVLLP